MTQCSIIAAVNVLVTCRDYSDQLCEYREQCAAMLSEVTQALELLQEMKQKHSFVSHKTGALHQACEQLMEDQVWPFPVQCHTVDV